MPTQAVKVFIPAASRSDSVQSESDLFMFPLYFSQCKCLTLHLEKGKEKIKIESEKVTLDSGFLIVEFFASS